MSKTTDELLADELVVQVAKIIYNEHADPTSLAWDQDDDAVGVPAYNEHKVPSLLAAEGIIETFHLRHKAADSLYEIVGWLMLNRESFVENLEAHSNNVAASVIDLLAFGFEQEAKVDAVAEAIA